MQLLVIDSTTAQSAPDSSAYASFQEEITLIADVTNIIDRPIFVPRIDATSATVIDSTSPKALGASFPMPTPAEAMGRATVPAHAKSLKRVN